MPEGLRQQRWCLQDQKWTDMPSGSLVVGDIFRWMPTAPDSCFWFNPSPFQVLPPIAGDDGKMFFTFEKVKNCPAKSEGVS